jgi:hypothetical protein
MNANCNGTAAASITVYVTQNCAGNCGNTTLPYSSGGRCISTGCVGGKSARVLQATGQNASCNAIPTADVPAAQWNEVGRVCAPTSVGGGCSGSQVCVPVSPGNGFIAKACIVQTGAGSCPPGSSYSIQHTYYANMDDTRGCSPACTCADAQNVQCTGGMVDVYTSPICSGVNVTNIPIDGQCHQLMIQGSAYAMATAPSTPVAATGSCTASNPQPTGNVTGSMPTTVCCAP